MEENKSGNKDMNRSGSDRICPGCGANRRFVSVFFPV